MTQHIRQFCHERDWLQFHNPKDLAIALVLEANEVLEPFRFNNHEVDKEYVARELADVLNFLLRLADVLDIDLAHWHDIKLKENAKKYPIDICRGKPFKYSEYQ
ncbi:nucleotide pyrophosphohydrolase [Candidatus Woesearchaeota archaeon]|nr:nucleotide pyrophosphohydrolase [Candidatus Woesearchaeota archaeon]